ncbi:hypothetical protein [Rhizobium chutanense]|uniref:Uncharacterized protein n=1 Tax=Rhizobium chutanense TaxID=2035448 RepID=A0A432P3P0_9HYPH|nr:hypothetical protein [Rhizobium chutanense]RUM06816.1 hypothetical protein EFR84_11515 [Rhizobium chutanense]
MSVVKLSSLRADLKREAEGDWIAFPDWPGVEFHVSSLHLPEYQAARDDLLTRIARQAKAPAPKAGEEPPKKLDMKVELGKLYAKHLLHDWRGLDVPYSPETAMEIMSDPEYRNVVAAVEWCAGRMSEIDIQFAEGEVKNSGKPSAAA